MTGSDDAGERRKRVTRCRIDPDAARPSVAVVEVVARLEGTAVVELSPLHDRMGRLVEKLFSDSVSPSAQASLEFVYENYRVILRADGRATFVRLPRSGT